MPVAEHEAGAAAAAAGMPFPREIPFVHALGLTLHHFAENGAELRLALEPWHLNSWQVGHGGVLMTMLDVAMAHAARAANGEPAELRANGEPAELRADGPGVATVEMKTSFVRPATGTLRAIGGVLHRSATLAFCEARVLDGEGRLCAHATGTFKFVRGLKPQAGTP
jgi:uncharacterized protein (TIGR00369 family)